MKAETASAPKKSYVLFPIGVALNFVLVRSAPNMSQIPSTQVLRPLIVIGLAAALLTALLQWRIKNPLRAGILSACCLYFFLYYASLSAFIGKFSEPTPEWLRGVMILVAGTAVAFLISRPAVWRKVREPATVINFLNITLLILIALPAGVILYFLAVSSGSLKTIREHQPALPDLQLNPQGAHPDVYYIILDGYGRADVLAELFNFDNAETIGFLENRGFYVAEEGRSNYIQTLLSVNSALNLDYLNEGVAPLSQTANRWPMMQLIRDSRVQAIFKSLGYTVISVSSVFQTDLVNADLRFSLHGDSSLNEFERYLLAQTAIRWIAEIFNLDIPRPGFDSHRASIFYVFDQLSEIPQSVAGPKFVFAHILGPHPPFVLDRNGNPLNPGYAYTIGDGSDYPGTLDDYRQGYSDELFYMNTLLRKLVDDILTRSPTPPVIILQGDHGSGMLLDFSSPEKSCPRERLSILNAYYLPGVDTSDLYSAITPVNSFRLILNAYFGANLELLEDKSYFSTWERPYVFTDVTDQTEKPCVLP